MRIVRDGGIRDYSTKQDGWIVAQNKGRGFGVTWRDIHSKMSSSRVQQRMKASISMILLVGE